MLRAFLLITIGCVGSAGCGGAKSDVAEPTPIEPDDEHDEEDEGPKVRLYVLADVRAVSPGQEFRLAARFDVDPTWHVYWKNPGEAGLPTEATFEVPTGFTASDTRYPGPISFDGGGGILNFGYEELVLLSSNVTAPDELSGEQSFKVKATWLACREICIPGEAEASMSLPTASLEVPSAPANGPMFDAHETALPTPFAGDVRAGRDANTVEVLVTGTQTAEYFPSLAEQTTFVGQLAVPTKSGGVLLMLSYKPESTDATKPSTPTITVGGVLATGEGSTNTTNKRTYHQLNWESSK